MNPDYRDRLTDLGISDRVVEEIQSLNEEYFHHSLEYASAEFAEYQEHYLRTEGFIR